MMRETTGSSTVLLYDGVCGFCNKGVQLILRHDRRGRMRFAPLQSEYARALLARHKELKDIDSVVLVETDSGTGEQRIYTRSAAALRVAAYLGGLWKLALVAYIIPAPLRDFFYNLFARYRYRLFGKSESCALPAPEERSRFIDI